LAPLGVHDGGGDEGEQILVVGGSGGAAVSEPYEVAEVANEVSPEETPLRQDGRGLVIIGGEELVGDAEAAEVDGHRPVMADALLAGDVVFAPAWLPAFLTAANR
jgi:dihydrofolate reductase